MMGPSERIHGGPEQGDGDEENKLTPDHALFG
jgi:hypothetical protein